MPADGRRTGNWEALGCLIALGVSYGCLETKTGPASTRTPCTACHGSPTRAGDEVTKAMPPLDLDGHTSPKSPGVGAHEAHLVSSTHGGVPCQECHLVPEEVFDPGHVDTLPPAEVILGKLAKSGAHANPVYDPKSFTCSETYCHGTATPAWTAPRNSDQACGTCHGLPPPAPHAQIADCSRCHGAVIDRAGRFVNPSLHVNGKVETSTLTCASCHGMPPPAPHPASDACFRCHGAVVDASQHIANQALHRDGKVEAITPDCSLCHGSASSPAPPLDLLGNTTRSSRGVGAHEAHLGGRGTSRPVPCEECHVVPATVEAPGHLDGPPGKLATFSGVASTGGTSPHFDTTSLVCSATYCHGPTSPASSLSPVWTSIAGPLGCDGCHGAPPPPPHLQVAACAGCHGDVVDLSGRVVNPNLHGDGVVQVVSSRTCSTCHGSPSSPAPPTDLTGRSERSSPGVGAHQAHLSGGRTSRPVPCRACHLVPATEDTPGHLDQEPGAEVIFSDLAVQNGATPAFDPVSLTCAGSYCHGPVDPSSSGTPAWNTTAAPLPLPCNACHGMPPATPAHAGTTLATCPTCHRHVASAGGVVTLLDPSLHVNGSVDF